MDKSPAEPRPAQPEPSADEEASDEPLEIVFAEDVQPRLNAPSASSGLVPSESRSPALPPSAGSGLASPAKPGQRKP
ncbi:MAG: hypothetical protein HY259_00885 [Chloroflexi bacterium]|nr:hypothetical protein [Chloroflexota bacterium]MBI3732004.1 hypothetical protein [Chloroflexota bacterium]